MRRVILIALILLFAWAAFSRPDPIRVRLSRQVLMAPGTVRAEIWIPRHAENRHACLLLDGPVHFFSCWDLAGTASPPVFDRWWYGLEAGTYRAQARLDRGPQMIYSPIVDLTVIGD